MVRFRCVKCFRGWVKQRVQKGRRRCIWDLWQPHDDGTEAGQQVVRGVCGPVASCC